MVCSFLYGGHSCNLFANAKKSEVVANDKCKSEIDLVSAFA